MWGCDMRKLFKKKEKDDAGILVKRTGGEKILFGIVFVIFLIYTLLMLYPLVYMFVSSFKTRLEYNDIIMGGSPFALPKLWLGQVSSQGLFDNFILAFQMSAPNSIGDDIYMWQMLLNSLWYCGFIVGGQVLMSCFTGYVMAKYKFKAREFIFAIAIFTMTIPIVGGMASGLRLAHNLGLYNTPFLTLFSSLSGFGFNFMVMYGYFKNVSWSYAEAVFLDGGDDFTAFFKVMLPQAKMAIVTISIVTFISSWNLYEDPLVYLPDYPTLAAGLYLLKESAMDSGNMPYYFAGLMISVIPVVIVYASFSDIIMKNFSVGGLKG